MDDSKIDSALAFALKNVIAGPEDYAFVVFVHTRQPPGPDEMKFLIKNCAHVARVGKTSVLTATLSRRAVGELSDLPWVRSIKLSAKRRV